LLTTQNTSKRFKKLNIKIIKRYINFKELVFVKRLKLKLIIFSNQTVSIKTVNFFVKKKKQYKNLSIILSNSKKYILLKIIKVTLKDKEIIQILKIHIFSCRKKALKKNGVKQNLN
jgi:hypothetical protein